jgi:AcrR family transcriptional regulator
VGRPREHDERTRLALLDAAERLIERGVGALSVRAVAAEVDTTPRAVYSLFGSMAGLVDALGGRAFDRIAEVLAADRPTDDPREDLVEAGVVAFRGLLVEHPALFQIGLRQPKSAAGTPLTREAGERALRHLHTRLRRLHEAGLLPRRTVAQAAREYHALCQGLAELELRDPLPSDAAVRVWRDALTTLVGGLTAPGTG